ncbi:conserved hypothetical protein [Ricinus communis]|uniref:Uncharacterized protein n=1 Tax=Ricinus communis TaxID=3988 RepID=B9SK90_RICCO|nr:conserved hypothetical protein [Ricinus communis]
MATVAMTSMWYLAIERVTWRVEFMGIICQAIQGFVKRAEAIYCAESEIN